MSAGYNGWANKETWLVNIWIDTDGYAGGTENVREEARAFLELGLGSGTWQENGNEAKSYAVERLRGFLQEQINDDVFQDDDLRGLESDLLGLALGRVDWEEIAEHYVDEVEDHVAEEVEV